MISFRQVLKAQQCGTGQKGRYSHTSILTHNCLQKRMEGEFKRGMVHGRATYYLGNGTRCGALLVLRVV